LGGGEGGVIKLFSGTWQLVNRFEVIDGHATVAGLGGSLEEEKGLKLSWNKQGCQIFHSTNLPKPKNDHKLYQIATK
jgi:hypothetical protein